MKTKTIQHLRLSLLFLVALIIGSCTKNFEKINKDPYNPTEDDLTNSEVLGTLFPTLISTMHFAQENKSQMSEQMVFGQYGGYFTTTNNWNGTNYSTLNPSLDWVEVPFKDIMVDFNSNYIKVKRVTKGIGYIYAWANIIRVASMQRVVDTYGPIPYTQIGVGTSDNVPFDDVKAIYYKMFEELNTSIATLTIFNTETNNSTTHPMAAYDVVYKGDFKKWIKFANSLKLRMAIRISDVDASFATTQIQQAINGGTIDNNVDNAVIPTTDNPYFKASFSWGDLAISGHLSAYMNGFVDPRSSKYMSAISNGTFRGVRNGISNIDKARYSAVTAYSKPAFTTTTTLPVFIAAETAFLKAEAALKGYLPGGDAQARVFYEQGINLSMAQNSVAIGTYLTSTTIPQAFTDPNLSRANISVPNRITVSWTDFSTTSNTKLEKIITQKWLANFPFGSEAWADFRRTGFPQFFPALDNLSSASYIGPVTNTSGRLVRRLTYPQSQYRSNSANVQQGVSLLGGADVATTDLWWAKKN